MEKRQQALYQEKSSVTDPLWFFHGENAHADKGSLVDLNCIHSHPPPQKPKHFDKFLHLQWLFKKNETIDKQKCTTSSNHKGM